jgi:phosphoribosyl-ATP pyrophosphohydrolase/phosphoribosyl-AMP cyclohydrolase/histidinol dehydrogenase
MSGTELLRVVEPGMLARNRQGAVDVDALTVAARIFDDVRSRGWAGALAHATSLGDLASGAKAIYMGGDLVAAANAVPADQRQLLERVAGRIRSFAGQQRRSLVDLDTNIGSAGRAGHRVMPLEVAGCYAPGGRFPLPSSVLMTAVTAREAGVRSVWVASPKPDAMTLAAAGIAGADGLIAIGGAQAIAAMVFGVPELGLSPCDVIVGPGNKYVTAAKHLATRYTCIDMLAGPSEVLVIADDTARPDLVAADLIAQAEHDPDASALLVTTHAPLVDQVRACLATMLSDLPTAAIARQSLSDNARAVVVANLEQAIRVSDSVAPEHLEIMTREPREVARLCRNYGGIFIGPASAEVLGDYGAGPNHVLPTGGLARSVGGLSVLNFLKVQTWLECGQDSGELCRDAAAMGRVEGLEAHSRAAELRLGGPTVPGGLA